MSKGDEAMSDLTAEALKVWKALQPMIDSEIKRMTRNCKRSKKMTVINPPSESSYLITVSEPYGENLTIPCAQNLLGVEQGETVWVEWYSDDMSTAIATRFGNGDLKR